MEKIEIEILNSAINGAVVKLAGRKFPGIIIQGDSLWNLYNSVRELKRICAGKVSDEALDVIDDLLSQLNIYIREYELTLKSKGLDLPYHGTIQDVDL